MSNHAYLYVSSLCVNLGATGTTYQGRPAWFEMSADGCPSDSYSFEPYKDLNAQGPTVCVDAVLAKDAYRLGEQ